MVANIRFVIADRSHDEGIRTLLRESSMAGDVALSFRSEPSYFNAAAIEGEHHAIIALDGGRVVCAGGVSVRDRYVNGHPARIGYLGRLRLAASHSGRFDVLRRGYACFRELQRSLNLDGCFTSIAEDNTRARQLLERGLPGFPIYRPVGELVTLVLQTKCFSQVTAPLPRSMRKKMADTKLHIVHDYAGAHAAAITLSERYSDSFQFHPRWTSNDLSRPTSPDPRQFRFLIADDEPVGCAAVWHQRALKQTVVTGYSPRLRLLRPLQNVAVSLLGRGVPLPLAGTPLAQGFISHLALPIERAEWLVKLIRGMTGSAAAGGARLLAIGFDARDPRLPMLQRCFSPFIYRTRLYTVHWPGEPSSLKPDGRLIYPEIALL